MMTSKTPDTIDVLELDRALTIRQAAAIKDRVLTAFAAHNGVELAIASDAEADLSFVQLVEAARIHAAMENKEFRLVSPAGGQVLETLERAGLMANMSAASRAFWLHEKETR